LELAYALDTLRADGVVLLANYAGKYLGDTAFEPFWAEVDRRKAVVSVHPGKTLGQPTLPAAAGVASPLIDFPFETTRTAVQLVLNGIVERYPGARIILAHAGGFMPYGSLRFAELAHVIRPDGAKPADIMASFQRFYFDTALSSGPDLPSLKAFAGSSRILFGTDFPYGPAAVAASFTAKLDAYDGLTADEHRAVNHRNAWTLFPRLAPQDATAERHNA
jgi:aminocarboxymuconate-semialdehyde decarboxylase